ncbi:MAG: DUF721 domain-containing protein [Verrucomicrobia bacterium]|nr:DUF721 domain-containing protein [Verrucomicrobiota bacterium]
MNPRLRRQVLCEWSGGHAPPVGIAEPVDLQAAFRKAFRRLGLQDRLQETTLNDHWRDVVGPTLASHCRPRGVRRGVLCVLVEHPAWLHQIAMVHKADMLKSIQQRFPYLHVKDLHLRIG